MQYPFLAPVIFEILHRFKNRGILKGGQKTPPFGLGHYPKPSISFLPRLQRDRSHRFNIAASAKRTNHGSSRSTIAGSHRFSIFSAMHSHRSTIPHRTTMSKLPAVWFYSSWTITTVLAAKAAFKTPLTLHHESSKNEPSYRNSGSSETAAETRTQHQHHRDTDLHWVQPFSHAPAHHLDVAITIESSSSRYHHNHWRRNITTIISTATPAWAPPLHIKPDSRPPW